MCALTRCLMFTGSLLTAIGTLSGCQALHEAGVPGMQAFLDTQGQLREEEQQRQQYVTTQDPQAFRWLLANRIDTGMTRGEVERVLAQEGGREWNDRKFKTHGGHYRSSDVIYRFGPDSEGWSIYLGFRDGKLINYDPREFE